MGVAGFALFYLTKSLSFCCFCQAEAEKGVRRAEKGGCPLSTYVRLSVGAITIKGRPDNVDR